MNGTKIFLTAVAVALTAILIAPAAQADENQYLNQAMADGMTLGKARAQADQAVGYASQNMGLSLGQGDGMLLVDAAVAQLC